LTENQISKYPLEELFEESEALFSVQPEVVAGALYGNENREFSIEEVRQLVEIFLNRSVI
jgi:hypothetical protein